MSLLYCISFFICWCLQCIAYYVIPSYGSINAFLGVINVNVNGRLWGLGRENLFSKEKFSSSFSLFSPFQFFHFSKFFPPWNLFPLAFLSSCFLFQIHPFDASGNFCSGFWGEKFFLYFFSLAYFLSHLLKVSSLTEKMKYGIFFLLCLSFLSKISLIYFSSFTSCFPLKIKTVLQNHLT